MVCYSYQTTPTLPYLFAKKAVPTAQACLIIERVEPVRFLTRDLNRRVISGFEV